MVTHNILLKPRSKSFFQSLRYTLPLLFLWALCGFLLIQGIFLRYSAFVKQAQLRAELAGTALEGAIQTGKSTAMEASLQPSIIKMLNSRQVSASALKEASAYLQNSLIVQPYISSISLYSHNQVVLRVPETSYVESEEDLFALVKDSPALEPIPRVCTNPSGRSRRVLSLIWYVDQQNSPACIIVDLDMDRISQIPVIHDLYRDSTDILLINAQNQVVFSNNAAQFAKALTSEEIQSSQTYSVGLGFSAVFSNPAWTSVKLTTILSVLVVSGLSAYLLKNLFSPLRQLVIRLNSLSKRERLDVPNSFRHQVDSVLHSLDALQETSREMMNYSLLTKLFTRVQLQDEAFLLNELLKHQVLLQDHTLYRAVVLRADGASFRSEATDLMLFKLKKAVRLLQWAVPSGVHCVLVQNDPNLVSGLLSVRGDAQPLLDQSLQIIQQNFETWKRDCDLSFTMGISYPIDNLQNLRGAYLQALSCTDQRLILGLGKLILPSMCASQLSVSGSQIKSAIEDAVQAILRQEGDCAQYVDAFLNLLWQGTYSALTHAMQEFATKLDALCVHLQLEIGIQEMLGMQLESMETRQQLFDWCMKWVNLVSNAYQQAEQRRAGVCMEEALQYIEQHFGDTDLSAQQVADTFHISPQYFSKLFNQEVRCSFPQYLAEKRLLYAYKLLSGSDSIPIQEVCQRCGYSSRTYFTSSFKKRFGIPPSKVRYFHSKSDFEGR